MLSYSSHSWPLQGICSLGGTGSAPLSCSAWVSTLLPWVWWHRDFQNWDNGKTNCFGNVFFSISPKDPQYCLSFENPVVLHLFLMWIHTADVDSCCCSLAWTHTELFSLKIKHMVWTDTEWVLFKVHKVNAAWRWLFTRGLVNCWWNYGQVVLLRHEASSVVDWVPLSTCAGDWKLNLKLYPATC